MRPTPPDAVALIQRFEGLHRLLGETGLIASYLCPAGFWTQAWGALRDINGAPVTQDTPPITRDQALAMLQRDLRIFEMAVTRLVRVPLTDGQHGALVSFTFNLGPGRLQASTLLRRVNEGLFDAAAEEFPKWVMAGGRRLPGLVARRAAERAMFLTPDPQPELPPVSAPARVRDTLVGRFLGAFQRARAGELTSVS